jgi:hypothetical protein
MATYRVQIIKEFDMEIEAANEAVALEIAREQYEDVANETVTIDELAD